MTLGLRLFAAHILSSRSDVATLTRVCNMSRRHSHVLFSKKRGPICMRVPTCLICISPGYIIKHPGLISIIWFKHEVQVDRETLRLLAFVHRRAPHSSSTIRGPLVVTKGRLAFMLAAANRTHCSHLIRPFVSLPVWRGEWHDGRPPPLEIILLNLLASYLTAKTN